MSLQPVPADSASRPGRRSGATVRRPAPQRKPTDVRTREILDVAARLFADRGYAETTMRNICAAVGLTLGSLYYHVESKEAVLVHIVTDTGGAFVEDMRRLCEQDGMPVVDCAYAVARRWMSEVHSSRDQWRVLMREQWRIRGPQYRAVFDLRKETEVLIEHLLERGIREGDIRPHDVRLTSMAIAGLMNSTLQWYQPGARLDPDSIADHFMTLVLRGIVTQEVHARLPLGTRALSAGGQNGERRRDGS